MRVAFASVSYYVASSGCKYKKQNNRRPNEMKLGIIAIFAALAVMVTMLAACGAEENTSSLLLESGRFPAGSQVLASAKVCAMVYPEVCFPMRRGLVL